MLSILGASQMCRSHFVNSFKIPFWTSLDSQARSKDTCSDVDVRVDVANLCGFVWIFRIVWKSTTDANHDTVSSSYGLLAYYRQKLKLPAK